MKKNRFKKKWTWAITAFVMLIFTVSVNAEEISPQTYIIQNGRLLDTNRSPYTGWRVNKGKQFYYDNGKYCKGWKKISRQYYYFDAKNGLVKNKIVGSKKNGYYYVDKNGVRVLSKEVKLAVNFAMKNSDSKASCRRRLKQCFKALCKYPYFGRYYKVSASKLPSFAKNMFLSKRGDCYYYAATMAYIARVLGYESRVVGGGVTARGAGYPLSEHGWCEVRIGSSWRMIDCSMQRAHTNKNLFLVKRSRYPFRLRCDRVYTMKIKDGKLTWK